MQSNTEISAISANDKNKSKNTKSNNVSTNMNIQKPFLKWVGGKTQIINGLERNDFVITLGHEKLKDGSKIKVINN